MTATVDTQAFADEWAAWHQGQEARIGDPHGFLAVTSINWLTDEPQRFPDAPGEWTTDSTGVHVVLGADETIVVDGREIVDRYDFGVLAERAGVTARWLDGGKLDGGKDVAVEVAKRGGYDIVRPRHPDAPLVTAYRGTPTFAPDARWAVTGRFVPFDTPRPTHVAGAVDRVRHTYDAPGRVEFELDGQALALTAFANEHGPGYLVLFTDLTSGVTTWPANRSLRLGVPEPDGTVLVDFNRATNLPCAYTDLATCPLPPAENRLPVAIEAGEQIPYERRAEG